MTGPSFAQGESAAASYEADLSCPTRTEFSDLARAKLAAVGVESALHDGQRVMVALHAAGAGFVGRLELHRADGSTYNREVSGAACAEVANALAFVLALALGAKDPEPAAQESAPESKPEASPAPAPPPPPTAPVALSAPPRLPEPAGSPRRSAWSFGFGLQLGARAGLAPDWALVESSFFQARHESTAPFGLTLRLGFSNAQLDARQTANGSADFRWRTGGVEACPARLRLLKTLELVPCAGVHAGQLQVTGHPNPSAGERVASKLWLDGLGALRLELAVFRWLSVGLEGQLIVPFTPYRFTFDSSNTSVTVYQVPHLASAAFVGLAAHFE